MAVFGFGLGARRGLGLGARRCLRLGLGLETSLGLGLGALRLRLGPLLLFWAGA